MRVLALALALTATTAFSPARSAMRMAVSENQGRREFGAKFASAAAALGAAAPANAAFGQGAKFSIFGLIGNGDSYSEGAAYGSDQPDRGAVYSAYSPFSATGPDSIANKNEDAGEYAKRQKTFLLESEKRFKSDVIPKAISRKAWSEVTTIMTRQIYSMRGAMIASGGDDAKRVQFFKDIEALNLACVRKKQDVAQAAYEKAVADFDIYKASI